MRDGFRRLSPAEYSAKFYNTDHHWRPEGAIIGVNLLAERLATYGIKVDTTHFDLADYYADSYPKSWCGSQGRQLLLDRSQNDDFDIYYPRFATRYRLQIPNLGIDETGDTSIFYTQRNIDIAEQTGEIIYSTYMHDDRPLIQVDNLNMDSSQKVLLIKDSFSNAAMPFLAAGVAHLTMVDLRAFNGSIRALIRELKPNVVVVMYSNFRGEIKWSSHSDPMDFR